MYTYPSLVPRPLEGEGPGTHCSRMLCYPKNLGGLDTIVNYSASLIRIPVRDNNVYLPFELYVICTRTRDPQMAVLELERMDATFDAAMTYASGCRRGTLGVERTTEECHEGSFQWFLWLPTGSICYEAIPFLFDFKLGHSENRSTVLVISPLVSLMTDQVTSLRSRGVYLVDVKG